MTRRILITGAEGFIGSRLMPFLRAAGNDCVAAAFDLLDLPAMEKTLGGGHWDAVVHLAAISHVPTAEQDPLQAFRANLAGTALLLEAIRRHAPSAWLVFSSTAQVYAAPAAAEIGEQLIFEEDRRIAPQNVYARTKWEAELLVQDSARREGLAATVLRLFNHTHKSQSPDFFLPHLYRAILAAGSKGRVPVGNLDLFRDIGALDDLLRAFAAVLARPRPPAVAEVFNVCSGTAKHLSALAAELARRLNSDVEFFVDPARVRRGEPPFIQGSHRRLTEATGWTPRYATEMELIDRFLAE